MATPAGGRAKPAAKPKTDTPKPAASRAKKNTSVITGVSYAWVNCADGNPRMYNEGDELPDDLSADEVKRLDEAGVFGEHPREQAARDMDALVEAGLAARATEPERSQEELDADVDKARSDDDDQGDDSLVPKPDAG